MKEPRTRHRTSSSTKFWGSRRPRVTSWLRLPDLQEAAELPWENNPLEPWPGSLRASPQYRTTVLGVDWGGGGEEGVSFTVLALLGFRYDGMIDVLWGRRLLNPHEHINEAHEILKYYQLFHPTFIAHDYTGAGILRETFLIQAGVPIERILPIQYVRSATHSLMTYHQATPQHQRTWYSLDKTRSLIYVTSSIKLRMIRFFKYDYKSDDVPGLLHDFLALIDEKRPGTHAGDIYLIKRATGFTDDFAQAVNLGCAALWHANDAWPNFAAGDNYRLTRTRSVRPETSQVGWTDDDAYADRGYFGHRDRTCANSNHADRRGRSFVVRPGTRVTVQTTSSVTYAA